MSVGNPFFLVSVLFNLGLIDLEYVLNEFAKLSDRAISLSVYRMRVLNKSIDTSCILGYLFKSYIYYLSS